MAIYRGTILNRLDNNTITSQTNWHKSYEDAHKHAEKLGKKKLGNNDNWFIRIDLKL